MSTLKTQSIGSRLRTSTPAGHALSGGLSTATASTEALFLTTTMKERAAERNGPRRVVYGLKRVPKNTDDPDAKASSFPYATGGSYVGNWESDRKHGFGTQTWASGKKYEGEWADGKQSGKGSLWIVDGKKKKKMLRKRYAGDWVDGQRTGLGVFVYDNGDRYEGQWVTNEREGNGSMTYAADGSHYEGAWVRGRRSGLGVATLANGDRYEGHWLDDKKEGPGRYVYVSTAKVYEGEWVDGAPKCGTYRPADPHELRQGGGSAMAAANLVPGASAASSSSQQHPKNHHAFAASVEKFPLPELTLVNADAVLSRRVAEIRQMRAARGSSSSNDDGLPRVRAFDAAELEVLQSAFNQQDKQGLGLVPASSVGYILERTRIFAVDDVAVERLLTDLEADDDTRITFAEFADMAALLTSDNDIDGAFL